MSTKPPTKASGAPPRKAVSTDNAKTVASTAPVKSQDSFREQGKGAPPLARSVSQSKKRPPSIGTHKWQDLKPRILDIKKTWEDVDPNYEGLLMPEFKKYVKDNNIEAPPININNILSQTKGTFGQMLAQLIIDPKDTALYEVDFDDAVNEFRRLDDNQDGIVEGDQFQQLAEQNGISQETVDECVPFLNFIDFVEFKMTGKFKNVKGLDGLFSAFVAFCDENKQNKKYAPIPEFMEKLKK